MSKQNTLETDILAIILNAVALANFWDNAGSSPATSLYVSLHTGDPGEAGDQTTSEATYTSYARVAIARSSGSPAWTVSSIAGVGTAKNTGAINFPACTGGSNTISYFGVGRDSSGAGKLLYSGALSASLAVSNGITPSFAANALVITED
jgi:hypothetical protein